MNLYMGLNLPALAGVPNEPLGGPALGCSGAEAHRPGLPSPSLLFGCPKVEMN